MDTGNIVKKFFVKVDRRLSFPNFDFLIYIFNEQPTEVANVIFSKNVITFHVFSTESGKKMYLSFDYFECISIT